MKNTELRIGNTIGWELGTGQLVVGKVYAIESDKVAISEMDDKGQGFMNIEGVLPIPLTPEWLERFGFKHHKAGRFGGQDQWSGLDGWSINGGDWLFRGTAKCLILVGYFNTQVKYVHSLQNLYFAITGKELELKR